jgi:hypothetical protein
LLVRARVEGHIEAVFPHAAVKEDEGTDYRFRASLNRTIVAEALSKRVCEIDYPNFKSSVTSRPLHDAYMTFWEIMNRLQQRLPFYGPR